MHALLWGVDASFPHLRAASIEESLDVAVVAVRDELRSRVQRLQDLDADAVSVVLGQSGLQATEASEGAEPARH